MNYTSPLITQEIQKFIKIKMLKQAKFRRSFLSNSNDYFRLLKILKESKDNRPIIILKRRNPERSYNLNKINKIPFASEIILHNLCFPKNKY